MEPTVLRGRVQSGKGDAARWLSKFNEAYAHKTGMAVFPGSLNVALDRAFDWSAAELQPLIVPFAREEYGGERDILLVPCTLRNLRAQPAFLWTTTTAANGREDPWVVEIIAPVGLRETFRLRDGDEVEIALL